MADTLGRDIQLDHSGKWLFLGKPMTVSTNDPEIANVIRELLRKWPNNTENEAKPQFHLEIIAQPFGDGFEPSGATDFRLRGDRLLSRGPGLLMAVDRNTQVGTAFVAPGYAHHPRLLRRNVLDCMALFLATATDRTPIHASAVINKNTAVLLSGPSGSGKSTLCFGLVQQEFSLLAEDAVYISERPEFQLWGNPTEFCLCPDARQLFGDLPHCVESVQPNGKLKINIDVLANNYTFDTAFTGTVSVCFIERTGNSESSLEPVSRNSMIQRLTEDREPGFDISSDYDQVINGLPAQSAWLLKNNGSLEDSLALIRRILS